MLELDAISLAIGDEPLFEPVSLAIAPGTVATIMGPSGSGKSSLLAHIAGLGVPEIAAQGDIRIDGRSIVGLPPEQRHVGLMFQDDLLFPHLSVRGNLLFGIPSNVGRADREALVGNALEEAELVGFGDRDPMTLSGGQRTRVALMRTLLARPRALLLDEPFSRLDQALRSRIRRFVLDHALAREIPVLLVTHDGDDAQDAGGPIVDLRPV